MEFSLPAIGVNSGLVFGIIFLTQTLKSLDKKNKFKKFYIFLPLVLGVAAAFLTTKPLDVQGIVTNALVYTGVSAYFYKTGKNFIGNGKGKTSNTKES